MNLQTAANALATVVDIALKNHILGGSKIIKEAAFLEQFFNFIVPLVESHLQEKESTETEKITETKEKKK